MREGGREDEKRKWIGVFRYTRRKIEEGKQRGSKGSIGSFPGPTPLNLEGAWERGHMYIEGEVWRNQGSGDRSEYNIVSDLHVSMIIIDPYTEWNIHCTSWK